MANVTVLGAGGATVTIALSSAENAAAAQVAFASVNTIFASGIVDQQIWSGSGTLPAPNNLLGGAIIATAGNVGALSAQYISVVVDAPGDSTVVGPQNANSTVFASDNSDLTYGNLSANAEIFFGSGTNALLNFQGKSNLTATGGTHVVVTSGDASTTVNLAGKATVLTADLAGKSGGNTINVTAGANATVLAAGASTIPATINAISGSLFLVSYDNGSAIINPGAANVTVVGGLSQSTVTGTDHGGRVTLFGGTGSVTVNDGQGVFTGGSAGNNVMFTSTVAGSATLTGGGNGDFLAALGSGQRIIAGAGNSTLWGRDATGPNTFIVGNSVQTTVFGGGQGGNTYIFSGLGAAEVDGRNEAAPGVASTNTYFNLDVDGNATMGGTFFIADFLTGVDKLQIDFDDSATVTYFAPGAAGSPMGTIGGTQVIVSSGATYNFFESGALGQDIFVQDIISEISAG